MIRFRCHHCDALLGAPRKKVGRAVACPQCGEETFVPPPVRSPKSARSKGGEAEAKPVIYQIQQIFLGRCPSCGQVARGFPEQVGQWVSCAKCGAGFTATGIEGRKSAADGPVSQSDLYADDLDD